ncbi:MAG: cyclic pyranopterin monophosphate synthase MoaC [Thermoprotei archaeon]
MSDIKMVEITTKPDVIRKATARGFIKLKSSTISLIREGKIEKGDVLTTAKIAAIQGVKKTWELIPLCHPIPITGVEVTTDINDDSIEITVSVTSIGKTGVEMEALTGVSLGLLTIWDMVKAYEKNERGEYPNTAIENISVLHKEKTTQSDAILHG